MSIIDLSDYTLRNPLGSDRRVQFRLTYELNNLLQFIGEYLGEEQKDFCYMHPFFIASRLCQKESVENILNEKNKSSSKEYFQRVPNDLIVTLTFSNPIFLNYCLEKHQMGEKETCEFFSYTFVDNFVRNFNGDRTLIQFPSVSEVRLREMKKGERANQGLLRLIQGDNKILFPNPNFNGGNA